MDHRDRVHPDKRPASGDGDVHVESTAADPGVGAVRHDSGKARRQRVSCWDRRNGLTGPRTGG